MRKNVIWIDYTFAVLFVICVELKVDVLGYYFIPNVGAVSGEVGSPNAALEHFCLIFLLLSTDILL